MGRWQTVAKKREFPNSREDRHSLTWRQGGEFLFCLWTVHDLHIGSISNML